jgi:hypothetical protein
MARSGALRLRIVPQLARRRAKRAAIARSIACGDALAFLRESLPVPIDALLLVSEALRVRSGAILARRRTLPASKDARDARKGARRGRREAVTGCREELRVLSAARVVRRASVGTGEGAPRRDSRARQARRGILLEASDALRARFDARRRRWASIRTPWDAIGIRRASHRVRREAEGACREALQFLFPAHPGFGWPVPSFRATQRPRRRWEMGECGTGRGGEKEELRRLWLPDPQSSSSPSLPVNFPRGPVTRRLSTGRSACRTRP